MQNSIPTEKESLLKIYFLAFVIYAISPICLVLFVLSMFAEVNFIYWAVFLYSMLPCAVIGGILSLIGWIISLKKKGQRNRSIGLIGTLIGGIGILAGAFGWLLLYVVLGD